MLATKSSSLQPSKVFFCRSELISWTLNLAPQQHKGSKTRVWTERRTTLGQCVRFSSDITETGNMYFEEIKMLEISGLFGATHLTTGATALVFQPSSSGHICLQASLLGGNDSWDGKETEQNSLTWPTVVAFVKKKTLGGTLRAKAWVIIREWALHSRP